MTQYINTHFDILDAKITRWMARYGILLLRISMGIIFLWFGALKFFPGLSPAAELATRTIDRLTFGLIAPDVSILILATWESLIGLGLILGIFMRATLLLLFLQMLGTISPIFLFPQEVVVVLDADPRLDIGALAAARAAGVSIHLVGPASRLLDALMIAPVASTGPGTVAP